ncbi:cytochrome P450 [Streptomyces sp. NRRL B-1347]|uniref:cytochrome P450 n=1 Tax=Streptomyces sp. NRRL B-1347 TaxID=1476877 RepID=UPI0004C53B54|nr:cytochrome P450 [Streptomyces sp. NRRL B-1347]
MGVSAPRLVPVRGPRGLPVLGNLTAFGKDPLAFLTCLRDEFGDAVTWSLGRRRSLFVSHPQHIAEFLAAREDAYELLDPGWAFKRFVGQSVIVSEGGDWRRKRSLVQPAVRPRQVRAYAAIMVDCARSAASGWRHGQQVDVRREMALITQRVILRTLFGNDLGDRTRALCEAMEVSGEVVGQEMRGIRQFLPPWVRTPSRRRFHAALATVDAEVHRLIQDRLSTPQATEERDDLLSRLLAARDVEGRPLTPQEVRVEAVTLWAAGQETTSTALTWAVYLLSQAPEARTRLEAELARVLAGRLPAIEDYDRLPWTRQIVQEALRLYPPAWFILAVARRGAALGGTPVPAGTIVWCSPWTTHRDPRWFPDPDRFRPERWGDDAADPVLDHAWYPFGGGQRSCLGARFAQVGAALILATLTQRFRLDIPSTQVTPHVGLLLQPSTPLHATLRAR